MFFFAFRIQCIWKLTFWMCAIMRFWILGCFGLTSSGFNFYHCHSCHCFKGLSQKSINNAHRSKKEGTFPLLYKRSQTPVPSGPNITTWSKDCTCVPTLAPRRSPFLPWLLYLERAAAQREWNYASKRQNTRAGHVRSRDLRLSQKRWTWTEIRFDSTCVVSKHFFGSKERGPLTSTSGVQYYNGKARNHADQEKYWNA